MKTEKGSGAVRRDIFVVPLISQSSCSALPTCNRAALPRRPEIDRPLLELALASVLPGEEVRIHVFCFLKTSQ